jgi:hypothetical protein
MESSTDEEEEHNKCGSFECDYPAKIVSAKLSQENVVMCDVEWKPRIDGTRPLRSTYSNQELRKTCPKLLLDYYETKLQTQKKQK